MRVSFSSLYPSNVVYLSPTASMINSWPAWRKEGGEVKSHAGGFQEEIGEGAKRHMEGRGQEARGGEGRGEERGEGRGEGRGLGVCRRRGE